MKKILAILLAALMLVACFAGCAKEETAPAADADAVVSEADTVEDTTSDFAEGVTVNGDGEYYAFLAIGADLTANDWAYQWAGDENVPCAGMKVTAAKVNEGDTFTVAVELAAPSVYTWYVAPSIIVGEGKVVDATVNTVRVNGKDITGDVDFAAGDAWWYEGTGNYSAEECVRLAGGYNEWGTKYIANSPADYSSIEYEITLNSVEDEVAAVVSGTDAAADGEYDVFIAFGGDAAAENDWGFQYYGDGAASNAGEITATNGKIKVGETVTVKLDFAAPVFNTWFFAPCLIVGEADKTVDATVVCRIDGTEVAIDLSADTEGKTFWYEGTGDYTTEQCVRLAGGWNEWAVKFVEEPAGFTSIEYDITLNSIA